MKGGEHVRIEQSGDIENHSQGSSLSSVLTTPQLRRSTEHISESHKGSVVVIFIHNTEITLALPFSKGFSEVQMTSSNS